MEEVNPSKTYKLASPINTDDAIYFTIVDGETGPIAFFVNSKAMESFQWVTSLMTSISKNIKRGVPIKELITDMKEISDPKGSYRIPKKSKYVEFKEGEDRIARSLVQHLGLILEVHMKEFDAKRAVNLNINLGGDHLTETFHPLEEEENENN